MVAPIEKEEKLVSARVAAELLGLEPNTLRKMAWLRKIKCYKVMGALRFKMSELKELVTVREKAL